MYNYSNFLFVQWQISDIYNNVQCQCQIYIMKNLTTHRFTVCIIYYIYFGVVAHNVFSVDRWDMVRKKGNVSISKFNWKKKIENDSFVAILLFKLLFFLHQYEDLFGDLLSLLWVLSRADYFQPLFVFSAEAYRSRMLWKHIKDTYQFQQI